MSKIIFHLDGEYPGLATNPHNSKQTNQAPSTLRLSDSFTPTPLDCVEFNNTICHVHFTIDCITFVKSMNFKTFILWIPLWLGTLWLTSDKLRHLLKDLDPATRSYLIWISMNCFIWWTYMLCKKKNPKNQKTINRQSILHEISNFGKIRTAMV